MCLSLSSVGRTDEYVARPYGNGDYLIIPKRPYGERRVHPINRGQNAIPNRKYVAVPQRSRGGGGFRLDEPGTPGEIIENPYCRPPEPAAPDPTPAKQEVEYRTGMSYIEFIMKG